MHRLLPIIALTTDKDKIDLETAKTVRRIIEYEYRIRLVADPVDAEGPVAKMEAKIRRNLAASPGPLTDSQLKRKVNYARAGLQVYNKALTNLQNAKEVSTSRKALRLLNTETASPLHHSTDAAQLADLKAG